VMGKSSRRDPVEPSLSIPRPSPPRRPRRETAAEEAPEPRAEPPRSNGHHEAALRGESRNERMHVRVALPFHAIIDGKRYAGRDISVSGFSTAKQPPLEPQDSAEC